LTGLSAAEVPRTRAIAAVAALIAILATRWATDFRSPVRRYARPGSAWQRTVGKWLRYRPIS